jgi:pimeloyl-ACP methyl ester carboxylesterase
MKETWKRPVKITAITLASLSVVYAGLSIYGAIAAMSLPRMSLVPGLSPANQGLDFEDVSFRSRVDNVLLKGWFLPAKGNLALIIVNGGSQNRVDDNSDTLPLARELVQKGYNTLLFDLRGRGESEGKGLSLSNIDRDIGGAVDYMVGRGYPQQGTGILGFCSGAASAAIYASQNNIGGLVLVGCFSTVDNIVKSEAKDLGIPGFLLTIFKPGVMLASQVIYHFKPVNPANIVDKINCPVLFVHEDNDIYITRGEMEGLYKSARRPESEFVEMKNCLHSQSFRTHPVEFIEKVDGFLRKTLKNN